MTPQVGWLEWNLLNPSIEYKMQFVQREPIEGEALPLLPPVLPPGPPLPLPPPIPLAAPSSKPRPMPLVGRPLVPSSLPLPLPRPTPGGFLSEHCQSLFKTTSTKKISNQLLDKNQQENLTSYNSEPAS